MQDDLAKQTSSHWSHSHHAISLHPSSSLSGEEKHWGCWRGETKPYPKGVFRDAVVVLGMQPHTMQIVRDILNGSAAVWLPHPPFLSLSPIYPPSFCRKDISLPPLATPAHTPVLYRRAPKCPAPSTRWSVSSGKRNSSTRNYITLEFGLSKTWRPEGRGLRVWETLLGISRARKRAWPPRSTLHPWNTGRPGLFWGAGERGFLTGPFPSGAWGWTMRGLKTGKSRLVRAALAAPGRRAGGSEEEPEKPRPWHTDQAEGASCQRWTTPAALRRRRAATGLSPKRPRFPSGWPRGGQADKLQAKDKQGWPEAGPRAPGPSSEPMSSRSFRTPRPISAQLGGAAFDWVGADPARGASCQPAASPAPGSTATPYSQSREAPRWRCRRPKLGLQWGLLLWSRWKIEKRPR